tara:strand:+ start:18792 stop:19115 length:324 start_codon:yes stop_codon:yes gene_type:complete
MDWYNLIKEDPGSPTKSPMFPSESCKVDVCGAITCVNNKDKKCMLPRVTINALAKCEQFNVATRRQSSIDNTAGNLASASFIRRNRLNTDAQRRDKNKQGSYEYFEA